MAERIFPATAMPDPDWWQALWPDPRSILDKMGVESGMIVVDLCCGDGLFTAILCGIASRVYAIDINPELVNRARTLVAQKTASTCEFIVADAMDIQVVVPELVDYVFLANTFHGVPDKEGLARAVAAILKPHGRFGIVNWHALPRERTVVLGQPRGPKTEMRMTPDDVQVVVEPAGFVLDRIVELPPSHYGAIFRSVDR